MVVAATVSTMKKTKSVAENLRELRLPSLNQDMAGFGVPVPLQRNILVLPSTASWSCGRRVNTGATATGHNNLFLKHHFLESDSSALLLQDGS